jgi:hypothetical protein
VFDYADCAVNLADWEEVETLLSISTRKRREALYGDGLHANPALRGELRVAQEHNAAFSPYVIDFLLLTASRATETFRMKWGG